MKGHAPLVIDESMSAKSPAYRSRLYRCTFLFEDGRREVRLFACASDRSANARMLEAYGIACRTRDSGVVDVVGPWSADQHGRHTEPHGVTQEQRWLVEAHAQFLR